MDPNWKSLLEEHDIKWVRFVWADLGNRIRGEAIHIDAIDSVASSGPAFTEGLMGLMLLFMLVVLKGRVADWEAKMQHRA